MANQLDHISPPLHGTHEGQFVGMFQTTAGRETLGDAGEAAVFPTQDFDEIIGGGLAFDIGSECKHYLDFAACGFDPAQKGRDAEVFG